MTTAEAIAQIERTLRHAQNTRSTESDSWLNGYQQDVPVLLAEIERLRVALLQIRDWDDSVEAEDCPVLRGIAAAALTDGPE